MKRTISALCVVFSLSIAVAGGIYAGDTEEAAAALKGFGQQEEKETQCQVCTVFVGLGSDGANVSACDLWDNDGGSDCIDIGLECVAIGTCQGTTGFFRFATTTTIQ